MRVMLQDLLNRAIEVYEADSKYVLGAQGQDGRKVTKDWIKMREHYKPSKYNPAIKAWEQRIKLNDDIFWMYDCSGLLVDWLIENGYLSHDYNANGLKGMCKFIKKSQLRPGCFVFRVIDSDRDGNDPGDRAHHIGIVVKIEDGVPIVVHAKGRSDGVVMEGINDSGSGYWELYGYLPVFEKEIFSDENTGGTISKGSDEDMIVYQDERKELVEKVQRKLKQLGYDLGEYGPNEDGIDGDYGKTTRSRVTQFQSDYNVQTENVGSVDVVTSIALSEVTAEKTYHRTVEKLQGKINDAVAALTD